MSDELPPTVDYRGPEKRRPPSLEEGLAGPPGTVSNFLLGFVASLGLSGVVWVGAGRAIFRRDYVSIVLLILVVTLKVAVAIVLIRYR